MHPEKKWAAGTNESNARANHSVQFRLLLVGLTDATLGVGVCESQGRKPRVKGAPVRCPGCRGGSGSSGNHDPALG